MRQTTFETTHQDGEATQERPLTREHSTVNSVGEFREAVVMGKKPLFRYLQHDTYVDLNARLTNLFYGVRIPFKYSQRQWRNK